MAVVRRAMTFLEQQPGRRYCVLCWANAMNSEDPSAIRALSALARLFVGLTRWECEEGACDLCREERRVVFRRDLDRDHPGALARNAPEPCDVAGLRPHV